jgi:hypothetical protein
MRKLALLGFMLGMFGVIGVVAAADKNDPTGTWKWKTKFGKGGQEVERTLKLENKEGKLTGTISGFGKDAKDIAIEEGKFKDGEVTFSVTTTRKDVKTVTKYSGKVDGDTIKGSTVRDVDGKEQKTDWEAKREKKKD